MSLSAEEGMPSRGLAGVLEQQEIKTQPAQVTQVESLRKTYRIWTVYSLQLEEGGWFPLRSCWNE